MRARIAVDAMGGDFGPGAAVRAACALSLDSDIEMVLVGDEGDLQELIGQEPYDPTRVTVRHASSWVQADEDPARAMRRKKHNSLAQAGRMVADGEADALVAGGNREACLLAVKKYFLQLPGVVPGFALAFSPQVEARGPDALAVLVDVGASEGGDLPALTDFAIMGAAYCREVARQDRPRVGLLAPAGDSGTHAVDGDELSRTLAGLCGLEFVGEVPESELLDGGADVVVCSGGIGRLVVERLERQVAEASLTDSPAESASAQGPAGRRHLWNRRPWGRRGATARPVFDVGNYGGSPALGFSQVCLHLHRSSNEPAMRQAMLQAARLVRSEFGDLLRKVLVDGS